MNKKETMQQYVARKLAEPYISVGGVAKETDLKRRNLYNIIDGKGTAASTIQKLHDFFRKIAE